MYANILDVWNVCKLVSLLFASFYRGQVSLVVVPILLQEFMQIF